MKSEAAAHREEAASGSQVFSHHAFGSGQQGKLCLNLFAHHVGFFNTLQICTTWLRRNVLHF